MDECTSRVHNPSNCSARISSRPDRAVADASGSICFCCCAIVALKKSFSCIATVHSNFSTFRGPSETHSAASHSPHHSGRCRLCLHRLAQSSLDSPSLPLQRLSRTGESRLDRFPFGSEKPFGLSERIAALALSIGLIASLRRLDQATTPSLPLAFTTT